MSSSIVCAPLRVAVKPSRQELRFLLAAHSLALWAIIQSGVYFLVLLFAISLFFYLRRWFDHQGICCLQLENERCWLEDARGERQHYRLADRHVVSGLLIILQLMPEHRRRFAVTRYLVLFSDAVDAETLRRLRVTLYLNQRAKPASSVVSE